MFHSKKNNKNSVSDKSHHSAVFIWYIVFVAIIPLIIRHVYDFNSLRFYYPIIDLIANSFGAAGGVDSLFKDLYSLSPNNIVSFLSTNFINLIALMGVSWNGIIHAFHHKSIWVGVIVTLFMYLITYLVPTQMIPYVVDNVQFKLDAYTPVKTDVTIFGKNIHLEDYLISIIMIIILVAIEFFFVTSYINLIQL